MIFLLTIIKIAIVYEINIKRKGWCLIIYSCNWFNNHHNNDNYNKNKKVYLIILMHALLERKDTGKQKLGGS